MEHCPATNDPGPPIYTHGWSARVLLHVARSEAEARLALIGWPGDARRWRAQPTHKGGPRWTLRGSAFLTRRKPGATTSVGALNKKRGLLLYGLSVQRCGDTYMLDLQGVRRKDLDTLMGSVLGLREDQWTLAYWRRLERYTTLTGSDAHRISDALGHSLERGGPKSPDWRKEFLVRNHRLQVPRPGHPRAKARVEVVCYRIWGGATAAWRLEARLRGYPSKRSTFSEKEGLIMLDGVLEGIVDEHVLSPIEKPARWEPCTHCAAYARPKTPEHVLPMAAWRGSRPHEQEVCNRSGELNIFWEPAATGTSAPFRDNPSISPSTAGSLRLPRSGSKRKKNPFHLLYKDLAASLSKLPQGTLSEVILDPDYSAPFVLGHLSQQPGVRLTGAVLTGLPENHDNWKESLLQFPHREDATHLAVIVDPDIQSTLTTPVLDLRGADLDELLSLPLEELEDFDFSSIEVVDLPSRQKPAHELASQHLANTVRELRDVCELTGLSIVLVTFDARPATARGDNLVSKDFTGDRRFRSSLGDAGRHYANIRLRVGDGRLVTWKDEVSGVGPGRIVTPSGVEAEDDSIDIDALVDAALEDDDDTLDAGVVEDVDALAEGAVPGAEFGDGYVADWMTAQEEDELIAYLDE